MYFEDLQLYLTGGNYLFLIHLSLQISLKYIFYLM